MKKTFTKSVNSMENKKLKAIKEKKRMGKKILRSKEMKGYDKRRAIAALDWLATAGGLFEQMTERGRGKDNSSLARKTYRSNLGRRAQRVSSHPSESICPDCAMKATVLDDAPNGKGFQSLESKEKDGTVIIKIPAELISQIDDLLGEKCPELQFYLSDSQSYMSFAYRAIELEIERGGRREVLRYEIR